MKWNALLYDDSQKFVSKYGLDLISFIPKDKTMSILDLGCGTGDLTYQISLVNKNIIGIDSSLEMINLAIDKYPNIDFLCLNAMDISYENEFDVVFSNAVFHWINDQNKLHCNIYKSLKKNGLLICEFGGYENIKKIMDSFSFILTKYNDNYINKFYFPSIEKHSLVLEKNNFIIDSIVDYDRPTILPNKDKGLKNWVLQFFSEYLKKYNKIEIEEIIKLLEEDLKNDLFDGENWIADYRRIRVIAYKK